MPQDTLRINRFTYDYLKEQPYWGKVKVVMDRIVVIEDDESETTIKDRYPYG